MSVKHNKKQTLARPHSYLRFFMRDGIHRHTKSWLLNNGKYGTSQKQKFGRLKTDISSNNSSPSVLHLTQQSEQQQKRFTYLHASVAIDTICCPGSQQRMPIDQCDRNRETVWCNNIVAGSSRMNPASLTLRASSVIFLSFVPFTTIALLPW